MQPSKQHLLSIGMKTNEYERSINSSLSQPSINNSIDELKSAKFDCDNTNHYDIQLTDKNGIKSSTLLAVSTGFKEENQNKDLRWIAYISALSIAIIHIIPSEYILKTIAAIIPISIIIAPIQPIITSCQ